MRVRPAVRIAEMTTCAGVTPSGSPIAPMGADTSPKKLKKRNDVMIARPQTLGKPMKSDMDKSIWANNPPTYKKEEVDDDYDAAINIPLLD